MANAGAKLSSFPEVNDIQIGDMFPLLSGGNTNAKIDYATLADAIIAKEVERATAAENKLESEKADKTTATSSADGLMSAADKAKLDGISSGADGYSPTVTLEEVIIIDEQTGEEETGVEITVTNKTGSTSKTVWNDKQGAKGDKGDKAELEELRKQQNNEPVEVTEE